MAAPQREHVGSRELHGAEVDRMRRPQAGRRERFPPTAAPHAAPLSAPRAGRAGGA